jgi:hypothetical protein
MPECSLRALLACGSKVLNDSMFLVFALRERKNQKHKKTKYHSAEGYEDIFDATA